MLKFSRRFKELRKSKNLTQDKVADIFGVTVRTIQFYEKGERYPDFNGLIRIADYFDVSLDYLVGRSDDPKRY